MIKLGAGALNTTPLDLSKNASLISKVIKEAKARGINLLCLPELCITGYGCEDGFLFPHIRKHALEHLQALIKETVGIAVTLGLPLEVKNKIYNAIAFVADGCLKGFVCKQHLAKDGLHYEPRWFAPWKEGEKTKVSIQGQLVDCGDLIFDWQGRKIGFEICEDAWVPERPGIALKNKGVDIILNPSASHFSLHKVDKRRAIVVEGSKKYSPIYVYSNLLGNEAGRIIYDGDTLIARNGVITGEGERLTFRNFILTEETVESKSWDNRGADRSFEEFVRAVSLGLFDYLRKSRSQGFVLSLSGGADSSSIAVLVYCMCQIGIKELGFEPFKESLSHINWMKTSNDVSEIMRGLLHCVYQGTENSSNKTYEAAKAVAEGVGATFHSLTVDSIVKEYTTEFQKLLGRALTWETDDVSLQNIQARVRSPGIWLLANVRNSILLTTSNRSEASVGYATMDGDTSGSLAPIAGIDKYFLQRWLLWMEKTGVSETGALPFLQAVNSLTPTAELRPQADNQIDEKDLMPYEVLSVIERLILCERLDDSKVYDRAKIHFGNKYDEKDLKQFVQKFKNLWKLSQWKRERFAPSFHLDEYNVDPRSWLRFPILSGGL